MLSEGRNPTIHRPPGYPGLIEEGSLILLGEELLMTREDFTDEKEVISTSRFGRYRYRAALTKTTRPYTRCYFDPSANVITNDGSAKMTLPTRGVDNIGSAIATNAKVNPGIPNDNWTLRCIGYTPPLINTPVLVVKNTGYTGIVSISGVYDGVISGQVAALISRRGDLSGVNPRCAIIDTSGVTGTGQNQVIGDTPIYIGSGLSIILGTDGEFGDWLFLNDSWLIDIDPSQVGSPVLGFGNTSNVVSVTSGGQYLHDVDETYKIVVTTAGGDGVAKVNIESVSGQDDIGPLTVNDGADIPLGTRGGTIKFTGIANLVYLDFWEVTCSAPIIQITQDTSSTGYTGSVSSSGDYTPPVDDTYTIEVVKGGPVGVALVSVTSENNDNVEDLPIILGPMDVGSNGLIVIFSDSGELAPGDTWTIACVGGKFSWTVIGDITGEIAPNAISGIAYKSDNEWMEFFIVPGSIDSEVNDIFTFTSFAAAKFAGLFLTEGTIHDEEMVFLLNSDKQIM